MFKPVLKGPFLNIAHFFPGWYSSSISHDDLTLQTFGAVTIFVSTSISLQNERKRKMKNCSLRDHGFFKHCWQDVETLEDTKCITQDTRPSFGSKLHVFLTWRTMSEYMKQFCVMHTQKKAGNNSVIWPWKFNTNADKHFHSTVLKPFFSYIWSIILVQLPGNKINMWLVFLAVIRCKSQI